MNPCRIFTFLQRVYNCESRIQLPKKTSRYLLKEEYIKEVPHEEIWSMGKFICIFHELTEKGKHFYEVYMSKGKEKRKPKQEKKIQENKDKK